MALMNCASGCVPPLSWLTEVRTNTPVAGMDPVKPHSSWLQREKESIGLFSQIRVACLFSHRYVSFHLWHWPSPFTNQLHRERVSRSLIMDICLFL